MRYAHMRQTLVGRTGQDPTNQHQIAATIALRPRLQRAVSSSLPQFGATHPAGGTGAHAATGAVGRKALPPGACGVGFVESGTGGDAFHTAARTLYDSIGFTKIPVAVYLKKI
jgi:hypothetical protein